MAKSKTRRKPKKGLASNPIILLLVLVLFAAVGANSMGLLDGLFGKEQVPAPPPKKPVTNTTANASQSGGTTAGSQLAESATPATSTDPAVTQKPTEQAGGTNEEAPATTAAVVKKEDPKPESKPKPQWEVPDFALKWQP